MIKTGNRLYGSRGMTLAEVMIATLIYALSLAAILSVILQSSTSGKMAELTYTACTIAKNHIERLKGVSASALASSSETPTPIDQYGSPDPDGIYIRTTDVAAVPGYSNLWQVSVSVYYVKQGVPSNPKTIATFIYTGG